LDLLKGRVEGVLTGARKLPNQLKTAVEKRTEKKAAPKNKAAVKKKKAAPKNMAAVKKKKTAPKKKKAAKKKKKK
jgi:hypothetical protein